MTEADARTDQDRWNERYTAMSDPMPPSAWLVSLAAVFPDSGRGLDVAGGYGRNAMWLAERGMDMTIADVSDVALDRARREAAARGLRIETVETDVTADPLPPGPWNVILDFHYLHRELFERFPGVMEPGGLLVVALATVRNLERHEHPALPYLLKEGELPALVAGLDMVRYEERWFEEGRHEARLVARLAGELNSP